MPSGPRTSSIAPPRHPRRHRIGLGGVQQAARERDRGVVRRLREVGGRRSVHGQSCRATPGAGLGLGDDSLDAVGPVVVGRADRAELRDQRRERLDRRGVGAGLGIGGQPGDEDRPVDAARGDLEHRRRRVHDPAEVGVPRGARWPSVIAYVEQRLDLVLGQRGPRAASGHRPAEPAAPGLSPPPLRRACRRSSAEDQRAPVAVERELGHPAHHGLETHEPAARGMRAARCRRPRRVVDRADGRRCGGRVAGWRGRRRRG